MDRKCFVQYRGYVEQFAVHVLVLTKWTREQNAEINCETFWNTDSSCSIQDSLLLFYLRYDFIWSLIINGTSFFDPGIFKNTCTGIWSIYSILVNSLECVWLVFHPFIIVFDNNYGKKLVISLQYRYKIK